LLRLPEFFMSSTYPGSTPTTERRALEEAALWYARLCSDRVTSKEKREWDIWHAAEPAHRAAWERIEAMQSRLSRVPGALAGPALKAATRAESDARRHVLRSLVLLGGVGAFGWWGWQQPARQQWLADLRTGVGEKRDLRLPDGSQIALNTRTSVDVAFDAAQRLLQLRSGEILIQTAVDPSGLEKTRRPFLVDTAHGRVQALGTRFLVRTDAELTRVTVLEKEVDVHLPQSIPVRVAAGQQIAFGRGGLIEVPRSSDLSADAWQHGSLVADNLPLTELLAELGRYRSGYIGCDPTIADLKISGAFPVNDTDRALQVLINGFPLRVETRTRFWVRVLPV